MLQIALAMPDDHFARTAKIYADKHSIKSLGEKNWSLIKHVNKSQTLPALKVTIPVSGLKDAAISPDAKYILEFVCTSFYKLFT